jgi:hypothetical protein
VKPTTLKVSVAAIAVAFVLVSELGPTVGQTHDMSQSRRMPQSEVLSLLRPISTYLYLGGLPSSTYPVDGEKVWTTGQVLAASEIIFSSNSTLIFDPDPNLSASEKGTFYVVARRITVRPGRAVITWRRGDAESRLPPAVGKAPPGLAGKFDGADGQPGTDGTHGNSGFSGRRAISVVLIAMEIVGGGLYVDVRGQDGGPGGEGQEGGDGGPGASGAHASSSLFDCKRGPGGGGKGGRAGNGGAGGDGGSGGDGGYVILASSETKIESLAKRVLIDTAPGVGGSGGRGGRAGRPGPGGLPGREDPPLCTGGDKTIRPGEPGVSAQDQFGSKGKPGVAGEGFVSALDSRQLDSIFK